MTATAGLATPSHQVVNHAVEDAQPRAEPLHVLAPDDALTRFLLAGLRSVLKRRIITLYCFGLFTLAHAQKLIDLFELWEA